MAQLITSARRPPVQNFMQIRPWGASRQMGEIYTQHFYLYMPFFRNSPTGQTPGRILARDGIKRPGLTQGCAFWGLTNSELIFDSRKMPQSRNLAKKWTEIFRQKRPCIKFLSVNSP